MTDKEEIARWAEIIKRLAEPQNGAFLTESEISALTQSTEALLRALNNLTGQKNDLFFVKQYACCSPSSPKVPISRS